MSLVISGVLVVANLGFINNFIFVWMVSWFKAWVIAFPTVLIIIPNVRKVVAFAIKVERDGDL